MRKTKKQTDKRKRLAQAVAVSGDELRAFADGVERSVDGWRCVDVDAFRREVERRGADDPLVLVYVDRLRREVGWYAAGWHYGARRVSEILQSWKVQGKVAPAKKDEAGVVINLIDRLPKFYAGGADYCEWVEKRSSTLSSAISLKLGAGLDFLLCAPMMIRKGEVGILNLDSIMPGASKVQEEEVYTVFGLSGEIKAVRLVGLISRWFSVVVDALREIGQVLGISAAIEDLCMAFDGFPDVLICGRVEPRGDLGLRIDEAKKRLEVVRREIAAADVARGAKGGAGIGEDGSNGAERQGAKGDGKHTTARVQYSDDEIMAALTNSIDKRLFSIWLKFQDDWRAGVYGTTLHKASFIDCWDKCNGLAIKENSKGNVVRVLKERFETALDFEKYMKSIRKSAGRRLKRRKKPHN